MTAKYFGVFLTIVFAKLKDGQACFSYNQFQSITIKTGSSFYQECHCMEEGYNVKNLKWLNVYGEEIKSLGPDTQWKVYTERRNRMTSLHIPIMSKTLSGPYKCVTEHDGRQYAITYVVDAYDPLYFINTNESQYIINGKDSIISCEARGETAPLITWHKGQNELVEIADDDKYEITPIGLKIKNVTKKDAGVYKCTASVLETGEEVDRNINVEAMVLPSIEEIKATPSKSIVVGDFLSMECVASGMPHPEYIWNKTDMIYNDPYNVTWNQEINTIIFDSIKPEDHGVYECIARNKVGEDRKSIAIEVLLPPVITEFSDVVAVEGSIAQIVCRAKGRSRPKIFIIFEGDGTEAMEDPSIIWDARKANETESVFNLTFMKVSRSHDRDYFCNASNEVDNVTQSMHMTVLYKPYFKETLQTIWGWNGKTVNLSCEHESNPSSNITWRYQGNDIPTKEQVEINKIILETLNNSPDNYMPLNITNKSLYGLYECTAVNHFGEAKKIIALREGFVPPAIRNVTVGEVTAKSVIFLIEEPDEINGPPVLGYTAEYDELDNYNITNVHNTRTWSLDRPYKIEKLKPMTVYRIKFAAVNEIGIGMWSENIVFETLEKSIPDPPRWGDDTNLTFVKSGHNKILRWKAPEDNGDAIDCYFVRYCPITNSEILQNICAEERIEPTTELRLDHLQYNQTYYLEIFAHNSEGNSTPADIYITMPEAQTDEASRLLSAGAIITISGVVVLICLILLYVLLLIWKRKGVLATCVHRKNTKRSNNLTRDKKGLLKDNGEPAAGDTLRRDSEHKEYEYNKKTGVITGKHSAV